MAWHCSGDSNSELVENLTRNGLITDSRVKAAFLRVDRANYAPSSPYEDSPQVIGHGATISAPHMHASALEHVVSYVVPKTDASAPRILDIGSGSGYLTHLLAELAGERGTVVGIEHIRQLRDLGHANMCKSEAGATLISSGRVAFRVGDGRKGWVEESAPDAGTDYWDVIHVGASAKEVHPELVRQLKSPGCMFIPVNDDKYGDSQHVWCITKSADGEVSRRRLFGVRYVPLTDAPATNS